MDRYVIRERRPDAEYPQGNQMIAYPASSTIGNNMTMYSPEMYYGAFGDPTGGAGLQRSTTGFANVNVNAPQFMSNNMHQNPGQIVSGIDPRYLAAYSNNITTISAQARDQIIPTGQEQNLVPENIAFGSNYQNRNLVPVDKVAMNPFSQQRFSGATTRKQSEVNLKKEQSQVRTRSEKLKALHKSGPRAFSGPVEKVLKWHKSLQDIGLLVFYEIVAKCVSIQPGERCAKNIVVRDDSGPAMQVVYYEVDFLLPELTPPCTIRVIGRMMPGTCRLQAFNVRLATGDDVATLSRRAAVAAQHVAKLCKEYGKDSEKITIVIP